MKNTILVILLLGIFALLAITSIAGKSGTCDEIAHHIATGVVFLEKGDLKMSTESPPLPRYIVAAPVVAFLDPVLPTDKNVWRNQDRAVFGRDFFFKYNSNSKQMLFASRFVVIVLGIMLGLLLYIWSSRMYGERIALFALFLYSFSPNILAHTRLATTDLITTLFMLLSLFTFWAFIKKPCAVNIILAGIFLGLAQLSKYSMLILYPILIVLYVITLFISNQDQKKPSVANILSIFLISLFVMWGGYGFSMEPILENAMRAQEKMDFSVFFLQKLLPVSQQSIRALADFLLLRLPVPLGEHILGFLGVIKHSYEGHITYFLGSWSAKASPLYFLVAFTLKTPIPIIFLLVLGLIRSFKKKLSINEYFLIVPVVVYFIIALRSNLQIGIRHLLPIYPLCFMISARSIDFLRYKLLKIVIIISCAWLVLGTLITWPHFLSYFNEIAGGPNNGWQYLRDSNIDWGQDLPALSQYLKENKIDEVTLEYFGEDLPWGYGINAAPFTELEYIKPENKIYAISVQYLDNVKWTEDCAPTKKAGYSIFIYDFRNNK
ncbi:MAG: glycosyltransferase family 39 protein [Candidatus Orphnella occulta]|nr:glycosyltransferase family 39 protein [Candidatus Orphnella occulta]